MNDNAIVRTDEVAEALASEVRLTARLSNGLAASHEEAHFQAGLFAWFRHSHPDLFPIAEAYYGNKRWKERADICLLSHGGEDGNQPVLWIEIKKAWIRDDFNGKPGEQLYGLIWDIAKVLHQCKADDTQGLVTVLFCLSRAESDTAEAEISTDLDAGYLREALIKWCQAGTDKRMDQDGWEKELYDLLKLPRKLHAENLLATYRAILEKLGSVSEVAVSDVDKMSYVAIAGSVSGFLA